MIIVKIIEKVSGKQTHGGRFIDQASADKWIADTQAEGDKSPWGDPSSYDVVIEDVTVKEQERKDVESERLSKLKAAKAVLDQKEPTLAEVRDALKILVDIGLEDLEPNSANVFVLKGDAKP